MNQKIPLRQFVPAIIWFIILCILVFLPGGDVPTVSWASKLHADKIIHFILFGILMLLTSLPILKSGFSKQKKKRLLMTIAISAILWGILTEIVQHYFVEGRTFDIWDWVADTAGVCLSIWLISYLRFIIKD